ncbi:MAG: response regulator [Lachnospiraceae bacterium]
MSIRVMITDDHSLVREGIKQLLELNGDFIIVAEASDGEDCLMKLPVIKPDVLLLDINMPKKNGLEVLKILKSSHSKTKVIILTVHNEIEYLLKAVELGINGYLLKDSKSQELKKAILAVYNNDTYIQPSLIPLLNAKMLLKDSDYMKIDSLTRREMDVLKDMAIGMYNKEIAAKLNISERTVKNHISNIFKKINVSDRTQAAVFAIRNNLIEI